MAHQKPRGLGKLKDFKDLHRSISALYNEIENVKSYCTKPPYIEGLEFCQRLIIKRLFIDNNRSKE